MTAPRTLTPKEIAIAREMYEAGRGIEGIARHLRCSRGNVHKTLKAAGVQMRSQGTPSGAQSGPYNASPGRATSRDPVTDYPIGQVPKGHPLYEADQMMLRARQAKARAEGGWIASSMAWD